MFYEVIRKKRFQVCGISKKSRSCKGGLQAVHSYSLPKPRLLLLSALSPLLPSSPFIHSFIPKNAELLPKAFRRAVPWPGTFFLHSLPDELRLILPLGRSVLLLSPAPAPAAHSFILFVALCTTVGSMTWGLLPLHRLSRRGCHQCLGDE